MALSGVALGIAALGTAANLSQQRKAQKAQDKADSVGRAQAEIENQRSIRQAVAAGRLQQAQVAAAGQAQGAGDSSGVQGGIGSAQTQAASNIGFARQTQAANAGINRLNNQAGQSLARGATFQAIGNLPGQFGFGVKDSAKEIAKNFGSTA